MPIRPRREGDIIKWAEVSVCLSVRLSVPCLNITHKRKGLARKPKFGRMEAHHTSNHWTYLEVNRSKITRPINAHTVNAQYLPNRKAYTNFKLGTLTEHEDPHHQQAPWPPRSKVKVARSRYASDRCWPINRERNVLVLTVGLHKQNENKKTGLRDSTHVCKSYQAFLYDAIIG